MGGVGGCEGGGGSGYKPVGLSTSDRISLYMESKSAEGAVVTTIGTATSVECRVSCLSSPSLLLTCAFLPLAGLNWYCSSEEEKAYLGSSFRLLGSVHHECGPLHDDQRSCNGGLHVDGAHISQIVL